MNNDRFLSMLSLCRKAGGLTLGADKTEDALRAGRAFAVLLADDASDNTRRNIIRTSAEYGVPVIGGYDAQSIARAVGRSSLAAVGVTIGSFGKRLLEMSGANNFRGDVL